MSKRQSVIDQKLAQLQSPEKPVEPETHNQVNQLNQVVASNNVKILELQAEIASKNQQLEQKEMQILEMKRSASRADDTETRQMLEELAKLRSLNNNREQILKDLDAKNQALRTAETNLKIAQNDIDLLQITNLNLEQRLKHQTEKLAEQDQRLQM